MHAIQVSHVSKSFGATQAVGDVSFAVACGELFGLLGPNGAGKTTIIRLILDIFRADGGSISILDGPMDESKKSRIGYMPEERGLYQDITLDRCLLYLASLKGVPKLEARRRLDAYLDRFDLAAHRNKKVRELSKGMQQKAQIINTILHQPEIIIIDEPFTALDPLNVQLVKEVMGELHDQGTTIVMSTHQMHQVEELCDRILLINNGRDVLYGGLNEIRRRFSGHEVVIETEEELPELPGVLNWTRQNHTSRLTLSENVTPQDIFKEVALRDIRVDRFEVAVPSLDEIFIKVVEGSRQP